MDAPTTSGPLSLDEIVDLAARAQLKAERLHGVVISKLCARMTVKQREYLVEDQLPDHDLVHAQAEGLARYLIDDMCESIRIADEEAAEAPAPSDLN